jgi:hypothetical protein
MLKFNFNNYPHKQARDRVRINPKSLIKSIDSTIDREQKVIKKSQKLFGTFFEPVQEFVFNERIGDIVIPPPFTTKINIFFDDSGSMNSTLTPLQVMATKNLKDIILPYYNNDNAAYDNNVTVVRFSEVPAVSTFGMSSTENSIVLGGVNMQEMPTDRNVINIMFQDETNSHPLASFTGSSTQGLKASSVHFLTGGLTLNSKNRAFFFQVDRNDLQGTNYRALMVSLSGALQNTTFRNQTTFTLDVVDGDSSATYAALIQSALSQENEQIN